MKKFLKIKDSNRFIYFKNRKVRTPAVLQITDKDLPILTVALKLADVKEYEVVEEEEEYKEDEVIDPISEEDKEIIIEELDYQDDEPKSLLEEFMRSGEKK